MISGNETKKEKTSLQKEASCPAKSRCVIESSTHYKFLFFFFLTPEGGKMRMTKRGRCEDDPAKLNNI